MRVTPILMATCRNLFLTLMYIFANLHSLIGVETSTPIAPTTVSERLPQ